MLLPYLWLLIIAFLYILLLKNLNEFPVEKIHLVEYGILGLLTFKALKNSIKDLTVYILSFVITFYVGMFDEVIQWIVPNRVGTIEDVWLNVKSSLLILMLIGLVIKPKEITTNMHLRDLKRTYIPISLAVIVTGIFINTIHGFGFRIEVNDYIEAYSRFSKTELRLINNLLKNDSFLLESTAKKFESVDVLNLKILSEDGKRLTFFKEAADHKWERDHSFSKKRFIKSLNEQIILMNYYSSLFYFDFFKWSDGKKIFVERFFQNELSEKRIYKSPVCGILITEFSKLHMWVFIIFTTVIFTILFIKTKG